MTAIVLWLAETTIAVALLATIVGILCRMLQRQPALQHALWLVVLLKMLTPSVVAWPWSLDKLHTSAAHLAARPEPRLPQAAERPIVAESATDSFAADVTSVAAESVATAAQSQMHGDPLPAVARSSAVTTVEIVFGIWSIGCLVAAAVQVRRIGRRWRLVRQGRPAPAELAGAVGAVARQMGARSVPVVVVEGVAAPFVWCLGRARLCWPAALVDATEIDRARAIIAHELAHVRRRDHLVTWLELAASVLWWWSPLFWLARARLRAASEMACDAIALGAASSDRRGYAELLLAYSTDPHSNPAAALGVFAGSRKSFERRLQMILSERVSNKVTVAGLLLVALVAALAIPGWPIAAASDESPMQPAQDQAGGADESAVSPDDESVPDNEGDPLLGTRRIDEPVNAKSAAVDKESLQYDGKSFEWWRDYLHTELKGERRIEGIDAMSAFGVSGRPIEAAEVIVEVLQGSRSGYQGESKVQEAAYMALKHIGPRAASAWLRALKAEDRNVRQVALRVLRGFEQTEYDGKNDVLRELHALTNDSDATIRYMAVYGLRQEADGVVIMTRMLKSDPDRQNRTHAAELLGGLGTRGQSAIPSLVDATKDEHEWVRNKSLESLKRLKTDPNIVVPILIRTVEDSDQTVRQTAIKYLGEVGAAAKPAVPALINAYPQVHPGDRFLIATALGKIGPDAKDAIPLLMEAMQDKDENLRLTAMRALERIANQNTRELPTADSEAQTSP